MENRMIREIARSYIPLLLALLAARTSDAASVSGLITGAEDGEPLAYTGVHLRGTSFGKVANAKGYYVLAGIPAGTYTVSFSRIGYKTAERSIVLAEDEKLRLDVELAPEPVQAEEIVVEVSRDLLGVRPARVTLETEELTRIPFAIETDVLRGVQMLPGVSSLSDFSSGLYVRGGSADQNLILLDDADVYNPNHLFGFFSTFNADAVKTVDLQKSAYGARYGGRLSSLLDVRNRDGNRKKVEGTVRSSVIASSATVEGPWPGGSWMVSGRHTYIEQLAEAMDIDLPYKFYDVHGKLNWDIDKADRTSFSYYEGLDRLDWDREGLDVLLDWGNRTASAQWTRLYGTRLFSDLVFTYSRFASRAMAAFQDLEFEMRNDIDDVGLKAAMTYTPNARHAVDFGVEGKSLRFRFERGYEEEDDIRFRYDGLYGALYAQETWMFAPGSEVRAGLRLETYSEGDYVDLGPRLSIRRVLGEHLSAHAGYGRYKQYLNLVSLEGASFADMWFPVDETLEPGSADHYVVGVEAGPFRDFDLSVEAYYKPYRNLVEFSEEFTRSLVASDAQMNDLFNSGTGKAYGADLYLRNRWAGFEGWAGYSLGWTRRTIDRYNFGEEYVPAYDRRHQFVLMQERPLGKEKKWRLSVAFRYGTGQPTTLASARYTVSDPAGRTFDTVLDGELNAYRLPAYHRLDVGLSWRTEWRGLLIEPSLEIVNLYDRENVFIRTYDTSKNPVEFEDVTMIPRIPSIGVRVSF
jgi:hypothetical protein